MKHTCGLLALLILCIMVFAAGCNGNKSVESKPNIKTKAEFKDLYAIIPEVTEYAHTYDPTLILGEILISFDDKLSLDKCNVTFCFSKPDGEKPAKSLWIDYETETQTITYCDYETGPMEEVNAFIDELNYKQWKLDLTQSFAILQDKLKTNHIDTWDHIVCDCNSDSFEYRVFLKNDDYAAVEISIPNYLKIIYQPLN